ncbi:MAG: hypothetical protein LBH32_01125 [Dysgonamonadaceae bacterium]|jgi:hypothetical protein|nr:hypothetical protein [Dysgonamonadaceae bacterium]
MKQYFKKTALLLAAIALGISVYGQVLVGVNGTPLEGAALEVRSKDWAQNPPNTLTDLENSDKGILFPKVKLVAVDSLHPIYKGNVNLSEIKQKLTGMTVYNVDSIEGLNAGLSLWNGSQWTSITRIGSFAVVECIAGTFPVLSGNYTKGEPLDPQSCTILVPVNVKKPGIYSAKVIVREGNTSTEAPFSFSGSGDFTKTGLNYLTLRGYGIPSRSTSEPSGQGNNGTENKIELYCNEDPLTCSNMPTVFVNKKVANFSFICDSISVNYSSGSTSRKSINQNEDISPSNDVKIILKAMGSLEGAGAEYHIQTDSINGIRFSSKGIMGTGSNTIVLEGRGKPLKAGNYTYTITGNDVNQAAICAVNVTVSYNGKGIKILTFSSSNSNQGWNMGDQHSAIRSMLNSPKMFDYGQYPDAPFHITSLSNVSVYIQTENDINNYISFADFKDYQTVFVSYPAYASDTRTADALCDYVKDGKTCLYSVDYGHRPNINRIIQTLSGLPIDPNANYISSTDQNTDGKDTITFLGGNLAVNGQYMDLTGKILGRDGGYNFLFANLPPDWIVLASNDATDPRNNAKLIMHKKYRMFLAADGGIFTGGNPSSKDYGSNNICPSRVDADGVPQVCTKTPYGTGVYNAHFLANLLIWAFEAIDE